MLKQDTSILSETLVFHFRVNVLCLLDICHNFHSMFSRSETFYGKDNIPFKPSSILKSIYTSIKTYVIFTGIKMFDEIKAYKKT